MKTLTPREALAKNGLKRLSTDHDVSNEIFWNAVEKAMHEYADQERRTMWNKALEWAITKIQGDDNDEVYISQILKGKI